MLDFFHINLHLEPSRGKEKNDIFFIFCLNLYQYLLRKDQTHISFVQYLSHSLVLYHCSGSPNISTVNSQT